MRKNLILTSLAFGLASGTLCHDVAAQGYRETGEKLYASQQRLFGISKAGFALGTGRLLDNNLRAGSGGYNNDRDIQNIGRATDLGATGNLRGLGNFRGNIDYRAAGDFGGNLGSNDFHGFNARSFGVSDLASVAPGSSGLLGGGPAGLQRAGAGVTAGDLSRRNGIGGLTPGGFDSNPYLNNPTYNNAYQNQGNFLNDFGSAADARRVLGMTMGNNGNVYEVNASPLKGLTTRQLGGQNKPGQGTDSGQPGSSLLDFNQAASQLEGAAPSTLGDKLTAPPDLNIKGIGEGLNKPLSESGLLGTGGADLSAIGLPGDARVEQKPDFIDGSMFRSLGGSKIKPGEDPYIDLLRKIKEGQEGVAKPAVEDKPATPGEVKEPVKPEAEEGEPADEKLEIPPAPPGSIPDEAVAKMVKKLRYRMEAMKSLSGAADNELNQEMKSAEADLSKARYFDAAASYAKVRAARNNYPLARSGQVHAQIGAGLYLSAATNLRELLLESPELMSARYDASLLPAADRLTKVYGDLATGPDEQKRQRTLLMAYIAYQRGDQESVRKHVRKLVELDPGDALARVLAGVWVDGKKGKAGQDAGAKGGGA